MLEKSEVLIALFRTRQKLINKTAGATGKKYAHAFRESLRETIALYDDLFACSEPFILDDEDVEKLKRLYCFERATNKIADYDLQLLECAKVLIAKIEEGERIAESLLSAEEYAEKWIW